MSPTYCSISYERLPVRHHGVDSSLLVILTHYDRDCRLLGFLNLGFRDERVQAAGAGYLWHLLDDHNILLVTLHPGERVQVRLHGPDLLL